MRLLSRGSVHPLDPFASSTKLATVYGACSGISRTVNEPMDVTNVASVMLRASPRRTERAVYPRMRDRRSQGSADGTKWTSS